jgi:uncharacterized spore protein YtfJ
MMEELESMFERLAAVQERIDVNAVFGEPRTIEGRTVIPVAEVTYGVGLGFGAGPAEHYCSCGCGEHEPGCECECEPGEEHEPGCECECDLGAEHEPGCEFEHEIEETALGGGGGAGGHARPVAYIEIGPEGTHIQPIVNEQRVALAGILLGAWAVGWVGLVLKTLFTPRR